jgi:hypothetical protein
MHMRLSDGPRRSEMNRLSEARALRALDMRRNGTMLKDIAAVLGVTKERSRQLIKIGQEIERRQVSTDPWDELSARVRNALLMDGCDPTLDAVETRYKLDPYAERDRIWIRRVLNIGARSIVEIQRWLARHGREPLP